MKNTLKLTAGLMAAFAIAVVPAMSYAANYAFVNNSGEVSLVIANTAEQAIATAFNRSARSGVILLNSLADNGLVGDNVSGI